MRFTVITATFNSEKTLVRTFESILNQTFLNFEYVIVDGNSKDNTLKLVKDYEERFKDKGISFKWISENDKGIYDAWNKGVQIANGQWISFLGSDDIYLEDALESYNNTINTNAAVSNQVDLIYSNVNVIKDEKIIKNIDGIWSWKIFSRYMNIAHVGSFHNKKYFEEHGVFDISYDICGDYELLLRAKQNLKTFKIEKLTALMDAGGVSNNQVLKAFGETYRAKHSTANISKIICIFDYFLASLKQKTRKILHEVN